MAQVASRAPWSPVEAERDHALAVLDGQSFDAGTLRVQLGRASRFGARYFRLVLESSDGRSREPAILTGLHHSGPLPSYNWVEVAETNEVNERESEPIVPKLWSLLLELLPPGGHIMVEYDSPARAETAEGLAHNVPALATPLGAQLYRAGFGAHFKDWQIAEGGSEGPRKLQAYKEPNGEVAQRWRASAQQVLENFLSQPQHDEPLISAARERAQRLLRELGMNMHR
jgi:hypothetical protein